MIRHDEAWKDLAGSQKKSEAPELFSSTPTQHRGGSGTTVIQRMGASKVKQNCGPGGTIDLIQFVAGARS